MQQSMARDGTAILRTAPVCRLGGFDGDVQDSRDFTTTATTRTPRARDLYGIDTSGQRHPALDHYRKRLLRESRNSGGNRFGFGQQEPDFADVASRVPSTAQHWRQQAPEAFTDKSRPMQLSLAVLAQDVGYGARDFDSEQIDGCGTSHPSCSYQRASRYAHTNRAGQLGACMRKRNSGGGPASDSAGGSATYDSLAMASRGGMRAAARNKARYVQPLSSLRSRQFGGARTDAFHNFVSEYSSAVGDGSKPLPPRRPRAARFSSTAPLAPNPDGFGRTLCLSETIGSWVGTASEYGQAGACGLSVRPVRMDRSTFGVPCGNELTVEQRRKEPQGPEKESMAEVRKQRGTTVDAVLMRLAKLMRLHHGGVINAVTSTAKRDQLGSTYGASGTSSGVVRLATPTNRTQPPPRLLLDTQLGAAQLRHLLCQLQIRVSGSEADQLLRHLDTRDTGCISVRQLEVAARKKLALNAKRQRAKKARWHAQIEAGTKRPFTR